MKDLKEIPEGFKYRSSWGNASYTHMRACVNIYEDENDKEVVIEIEDKNEVYRIVKLSLDEYLDLSRDYPTYQNGMPLLYHFGYYQKEHGEYDDET